MTDYSIRPLGQGDADLIADYFHTLLDATKEVFPGYPFTDAEARRIAEEETDSPNLRRYIVIARNPGEKSGLMAGTIWFWRWDCKIPWIGISIGDGHQGRGLGKTMMRHAVDRAIEEGKGGILLTTHKDNVRGQALYKRFGFERIGQDDRGERLMLLNFKQ